MPIELHWYDARHTILIWQFNSQWNWDDFYMTLDHSNALLQQKPHRVHVVGDLSASASLPTGIMTHAANAIATRPANLDRLVIVGPHPLLRNVFQTFLNLYGRTHRLHQMLYLVPRFEDALPLLTDQQVAERL